MGEKIFFTWETQVIVLTIVFELIMISSIVYLCWNCSFKDITIESIARISIALIIIIANISLLTITPVWLEYNDKSICIKKVIGNKTILYEDIEQIESISPKVISGSIRKRASGGACGYVGIFKNRILGEYMMYATEKRNLILVKCNDEIIIFNSNKRDELVAYVKNRVN